MELHEPLHSASGDAPTKEAYDDLELAYTHLNRYLFDGNLPGVIFTLQRSKRYLGFFSRKRFQHVGTKAMVDEIAMNPAYFAIRPVEAVLSTLAHEMCHQWQAHFGQPGRRGYHNREFADKMKSIGLQASATGRPGGKEVGEAMSHFILPDGAFLASVSRLLETEFRLSWLDRYPARAEYVTFIPSEDELRDLYPDEYQDETPNANAGNPPPLLVSVLQADGITPIESPAAGSDQHLLLQDGDGHSPAILLAMKEDDAGGGDDAPRIVVPPKGVDRRTLSTPPAASGLDVEFPPTGPRAKAAKTTRCKFVCPACGDAAWGKPGLHLICGKCKTRMPREGEGDTVDGSRP